MADTVNIPELQFVDLGLSTINVLDKGTSRWTPTTRFGRPTDVSHWSTPNHIFGKNTVVGDAVRAKSYYNYKTGFENWRKNQEFERQNNARSRPPLDLTTVVAKTPDPKILTLTTNLSKNKEKERKEYQSDTGSTRTVPLLSHPTISLGHIHHHQEYALFSKKKIYWLM